MNPAAFSVRMAAYAAAVEQGGTAVCRRAALAAATAVIMATPVDTGRARANWLVGLDGPVRDTIDTLGENPGAAIEAARAEIEKFSSANKEIYLSNNLPYIGRLNEGWSAQAPAGFVEQAVASAVQAVRGARLLYGG